MNADLLAMLGGGGMGGLAGAGQNRPRDDGKIIFTLKAGKMTTELLENGKYKVTPVKNRGEIHLIWQPAPPNSGGGTGGGGGSGSGGATWGTSGGGGNLKFEWKDRRTNVKDLEHSIFEEDNITFKRITKDVREVDRIYLMQWTNVPDKRYFFWLQDKSTDDDDELVQKFNGFLKDLTACATEAGDERGVAAIRATAASNNTNATTGGATATTTIDSDALTQALQNAGAGGTTAGTGGGAQVDALSSILENLGIPPPTTTTGGGGGTSTISTRDATAPTAAASSSTTSSSGQPQLTLADLQGAMAGLQTTSPGSSPAPTGAAARGGAPLNELLSADNVIQSGILANDEFKSKLVALLPEGQQTSEHLEANLRSPQLQQTLARLTDALNYDMETFGEVLANFQLDSSEGTAALIASGGNRIQAFLDCVAKQVKKEQSKKDNDEEEKMEE